MLINYFGYMINNNNNITLVPICRYDLKMRAQEDRMRALGLMEPMTMLALDEWEIPRDRVVINRLVSSCVGCIFGKT